MSVALEDIWSEQILPISKPPSPQRNEEYPEDEHPRPAKRRRSSLFLEGSDDELPVSPKTPSRPDIDSLFEELEGYADGAEIPETFDIDAYRREAGQRAALAEASNTLTPRAVQSSSPPPEGDEKRGENGKPGKGEKKERKPIPKLDETRLLGKDGFPALIAQSKGFKPKGKGCEIADLNRLMSIYQFWSHKMYPKIQFSDTVDRVEKLCRQRRMQVALSVWRDEANGTINGVKVSNAMDVDPASDNEAGAAAQAAPSSPSSHPVARVNPAARAEEHISRPPSSASEPPTDDDAFDIDAFIAEEGELASTRTLPVSSVPLNAGYRTAAPVEDEDAMWAELSENLSAFDDPPPPMSSNSTRNALPEKSISRQSHGDENDDMWDVLDELESTTIKPVSNPAAAGIHSKEEANIVAQRIETLADEVVAEDTRKPEGENVATNDQGWDDMYV